MFFGSILGSGISFRFNVKLLRMVIEHERRDVTNNTSPYPTMDYVCSFCVDCFKEFKHNTSEIKSRVPVRSHCYPGFASYEVAFSLRNSDRRSLTFNRNDQQALGPKFT